MAIFAIIKQPGVNSDSLGDQIAANFAQSSYVLSDSAWLVSSKGTAKDLSDRLDITSGEGGSAVVVEVGSYYGRANPAIWTWIKENWEGGTVG